MSSSLFILGDVETEVEIRHRRLLQENGISMNKINSLRPAQAKTLVFLLCKHGTSSDNLSVITEYQILVTSVYIFKDWEGCIYVVKREDS